MIELCFLLVSLVFTQNKSWFVKNDRISEYTRRMNSKCKIRKGTESNIHFPIGVPPIMVIPIYYPRDEKESRQKNNRAVPNSPLHIHRISGGSASLPLQELVLWWWHLHPKHCSDYKQRISSTLVLFCHCSLVHFSPMKDRTAPQTLNPWSSLHPALPGFLLSTLKGKFEICSTSS